MRNAKFLVVEECENPGCLDDGGVSCMWKGASGEEG